MGERPVTGSCQQCGRAYELLIPEPGSGDLQIHRIGSAFSWCIRCDRLVGRACCWVADAGLCSACAALDTGRRSADPALAGKAVAGVASATRSLTAVEEHLGTLPTSDPAAARGAWEDLWLEVGTQVARADSARFAGAARIPPAGNGAGGAGLRERMGLAVRLHLQRRRSAIGRLAVIGRRIVRPASRPAGRPAPSQTLPASRVTARRLAPAPRPVAPAPVAPVVQTAARRAPRPRRRHALPVLLVGILTLIGAAVVAATVIDPERRFGASSGESPAAPPASTPAASEPAASAPTASAPTTPPSQPAEQAGSAATFDLERLGPLTTDGTVARVLGAPEVAAFPSPFDRSLRLASDGAGACFGDGPAAARVVELDVYSETGAPPALGIDAGSGHEGWMVRVDLATLPGLAPGAWYHLVLSRELNEPVVALRLTSRDAGGTLHEAELPASPPGADTQVSETCIRALGAWTGGALHVDNVRSGS